MSSEIRKIASDNGFDVVKVQDLPEIDGQAVIMDHVASRAKLLYLKNDDNNKSFSITFKTPAADDTGVFHILEHSVLCGSKRFPVKEPFVNLLKTSMQTFLNAMTFPDKTMYPVASTNEQDLLNLMDVYMDAVFNPNIYVNPKIFEQEGWHLELENAYEDGEEVPLLAYNGVVYNEMKGALSDPDSVLYDALCQALFPDTTYKYESGGIPNSITDLTYEKFLDEHARHYRPDNSYIVLYGDLDIDRFLKFLNERYLKELAERSDAPHRENPLESQPPISGIEIIKEMETTPDNSCAALGFVIGNVTDRIRVMAADILLDAIAGSNEAPLMRDLMDAKIADDCSAMVSSSLLQPFVMIQAKGLKDDGESRLDSVVTGCIEKLAAGELDESLIVAALSHAEFSSRERNFGYADGVVLSMMSLHGWLYDDDCALSYIEYIEAFEELRRRIGTGYYQQLLRELFLENDHTGKAQVIVADDAIVDLDGKLQKLQSSLTEETIEEIIANVDELRLAQTTPDSREDLAKLPKLSKSDIGPNPTHPTFDVVEGNGRKLIRHSVETHGIVYAHRYFDMSCVSFDDLPYASILALLLGHLDTTEHSAAQIDTLVQSKLGNLSLTINVYDVYSTGELLCKFEVNTSALSGNVDQAFDIPQEVISSTIFNDSQKIKEILTQKRVACEAAFMNSGNTVASLRSLSYCMESAVLQEKLFGIDFYMFLKELLKDFDNRFEGLKSKLNELSNMIFNPLNEIYSFAGDDDALRAFGSRLDSVPAGDPATLSSNKLTIPKPTPKREGFVVPSDVSFTAMSANFEKLDSKYSGVWYLISGILTYDYLWNEVRVKGGAYGVSFQVGRSGLSSFKSFRDPHIDETLDRFAASPDWLSSLPLSEDEFDGHVVAAIGRIDAPVKARSIVKREDNMYFAGLSYADRDKTREEVLSASLDDVKELSGKVKGIVDAKLICSVGSKEIIDASSQGFEVVDLFA